MSLELLPIPPGRWAVGVSGGADSVALLLATHALPHLHLHIAHLNHQTRGEESNADATFVSTLATQLSLPCTIATRSDLEPLTLDLPSNPSARYRALRHQLFRQTCRDHNLQGVLLAHHADDQAETVLHRLLRNSSLPGLPGISPDTTLAGLRILRPLLSTRRTDLRSYLTALNQSWREDASNQSPTYLRNRLRQLLAAHPDLVPPLFSLAHSARTVRDWATTTAPVLPESFRLESLNYLPGILADTAARRWLTSRGVPPADIDPAVVTRLLHLASDAASPPSINLPGNVTARRRAGTISAR